ncbi:NYN domain-containing protein [Adhaeretor mobilis]|uniref:NYN domain protein n=1 Tax=Adhaeretor mobilis TaxID=1930276 RepID=A0A517MQN5_9BACT|nr:NYN domain-containing protein [Adhaeretor mobilis]QDS97196.1 NYN domain protein [Adhaeretor mobilis]
MRIETPQIALLIDYQSLNDDLAEQAKHYINFFREMGTLSIKRAYVDSHGIQDKRFHSVSRAAIELVALHFEIGSGRASVQVALAVDALEIARVNPNIDTFILVAKQVTPYLSLVQKLRELGKYCCLVQKDDHCWSHAAGYCDEYIPIHRILRTENEAVPDSVDKFSLLKRALHLLAFGSPVQKSGLRSKMLQLDPSFHESLFGYQAFDEYVWAAKEAGILVINQSEGGETIARVQRDS